MAMSTSSRREYGDGSNDSELVIGLAAAVGTDLEQVRSALAERLPHYGYTVEQVRLTQDVIPTIVGDIAYGKTEYERLIALMDAGNEARKRTQRHEILGLGAAAKIRENRSKKADESSRSRARHAYIVSSLKHPAEVKALRAIYSQGFFLLGTHADEQRRFEYLVKNKRMTAEQAKLLMRRDEQEVEGFGQQLSDTFHLSDVFVALDGNTDRLRESVARTLDLFFGNPFVTPTFDEFAMFMAFGASLRSADLSRQVGAVIARDEQVVATGANDCPRAGGGLYWPRYDPTTHAVVDEPKGRDYMRGVDSNREEQRRIIQEIIDRCENEGIGSDEIKTLRKILDGSRIRDLTEFGRVVHAEMEALLSCARAGVGVRGGTIYSTTFPCHNCAKHIIAAGLTRVVFVEPYAKSKAAEFHDDSIVLPAKSRTPEPEVPSGESKSRAVRFEPFVGIGPRRFLDLFSTRLGSGYPLTRKSPDGRRSAWKAEEARLRLSLPPLSYLDRETNAAGHFEDAIEKQGAPDKDGRDA